MYGSDRQQPESEQDQRAGLGQRDCVVAQFPERDARLRAQLIQEILAEGES